MVGNDDNLEAVFEGVGLGLKIRGRQCRSGCEAEDKA
jgi:hypothetical protein